jgi:hypothetical protein
VARCLGSVPSGQPLETATPGAHTFTLDARDRAGNRTTVTRSYTVAPPPTISITSPVDGSFVHLAELLRARFTCTDRSGSGLASCTATLDGRAVANNALLDTIHGGAHTLSVRAVDRLGSVATSSSRYTVDVTPPTIVLTMPPASASYTVGTDVRASYSCADTGGSGVTLCRGVVPNGSPIDTATVGPKVFVVTAIDATGNVAAVARSYRVTAVQAIVPVLECVSNVTATGYRAWFGYSNPNTRDIAIPVGSRNTFSPVPANRGQPTTFTAGRQVKAFSVLVSGTGTLTWTLDGKAVIARRTSPAC